MRVRPRSGALRVVAAVAAGVLLAACGSGGGGGGKTTNGVTTAKIGVLPIVEVAPIYLGIQKGFYREEKIDLQPQLAQGGAAIVPAVVSGQYQFGFSNIASLLIAQSKGLPLRMVAASSESTGQVGKDLSAVVVNADSPIRTPADLEGKTVSVNTLKNVGDVTIKSAMDKHGADGSKVKFTELGFPDMQAALDQHRIDAAWLVEPFLSAALAKGGRAVLWNYADTDPNLIIAGYFVSQQMRSKNPDLVDRFVRATKKSMQYAQDHPDEAKQIITTYTKVTSDQASAIVLPKYDADIDASVMQHVAGLVSKYGLTEKTPDVGALTGG